MLRSSEKETEILLGNKQLLGIFFVVAVLLGVAFYGGYMVGRGPAGKTPVSAPATTETAATPKQSPSAGETHSFPADNSAPADQSSSAASTDPPPLGSPKHKEPEITAPQTSADFTPESGQEFLQVAAVGKDEAAAIADVLHKKGFRAHAVPKTNTKLYRVIVGPVRDAGDLNSTRDALRRTGFREIFVQRY
jgi:cell division septation protein DedD